MSLRASYRSSDISTNAPNDDASRRAAGAACAHSSPVQAGGVARLSPTLCAGLRLCAASDASPFDVAHVRSICSSAMLRFTYSRRRTALEFAPLIFSPLAIILIGLALSGPVPFNTPNISFMTLRPDSSSRACGVIRLADACRRGHLARPSRVMLSAGDGTDPLHFRRVRARLQFDLLDVHRCRQLSLDVRAFERDRADGPGTRCRSASSSCRPSSSRHSRCTASRWRCSSSG